MTDRQAARVSGALFLLAFVLYGGGVFAMVSGRLVLGLTLLLLNSAAVITIGLLFRGIIRRDDPITANIYLVGRLFDGGLLGAGGVFWALSGGSDAGATVNLALYHAGMIGFGVASLFMGLWLIRHARAPVWLGAFCVVGYACLVLAMILETVGMGDLARYVLAPGALFELVFGIWLIAFGLRTPRAPEAAAAPVVSG